MAVTKKAFPSSSQPRSSTPAKIDITFACRIYIDSKCRLEASRFRHEQFALRKTGTCSLGQFVVLWRVSFLRAK